MNMPYSDTGLEAGHAARDPLNGPELSDEAVVALHDSIYQLLDRFEACYGAQLDRFYQALYDASIDDALDVGIDWPM